MALEPADLDVATLAFLAGSAANERLLERIRAAGHGHLRTAHGFVFQRLVQGSRTVGELASALGVTQQAASKSATELEGLGYVRRRPDASDRRVARIELTERGRDAIEVARRIRREFDAELSERVGARSLEEAKRVLAALLAMAGGEAAVRARSVRPPAG
jgi:DNA-binding MarR family transcriptional regulator